jgi:hypothetical protein
MTLGDLLEHQKNAGLFPRMTNIKSMNCRGNDSSPYYGPANNFVA